MIECLLSFRECLQLALQPSQNILHEFHTGLLLPIGLAMLPKTGLAGSR